MERIGLFGGTFNPPHIGHIQAAVNGMTALKLDRMLLIPSRISPHKQLPDHSPTAWQRLEMLQIAAEGLNRICVSDLETSREGVSYTWQTVELVRKAHPDARLFLFMGSDMFLSFHQWREAKRIMEQAVLAVFYRGGKGEMKAVSAQKAALEQIGASVELVKNDICPLSSTDVRRMIAFGCGGAFLPAGVETYIRRQGLYHCGTDFRNLSMDTLEKVVVGLLNPNRVAHVLGCRDTAAELARRWGAEETDAARAGMLHDVTKALPGDLQLALCREYGVSLDEFSRENPKTLHALTGSLVAQRVFGENPAVVDAIRYHTTGRANMGLLEKIIYVADYMEPNRDFPGVERLRELAVSDIDGALMLGLEMTLEHLRRQGSVLSPESAQALEYLKSHRKG